MKRSQINTILADAEDFLDLNGHVLPSFAYWDPEEFKAKVQNINCSEIIERKLGWVVSDFGLGNFAKEGIVVFCSRRGDYHDLETGRGKLYTEKFILSRLDQRVPFHRHEVKTEDVVNRGPGTFSIRLYHSKPTGDLDEERNVVAQVDGQTRDLAPGEVVPLRPGEGLTLDVGVYHEFTASGKDTVVAEISLANDDDNDNIFYDPVALMQEVEEDEPPRRLLANDYAKFIGDAYKK